MNLENLGHKLRKARKSRDLTLKQVSSRLGVNSSYLSEIERGNKTPSLKVLCDIAVILDLQSSFFREAFEDKDDEVKSFSDMLVSRRRELGLTKDELARTVGWPKTYINSVEGGDRKVTGEFVQDLAKALKLPRVFFEFSPSEAMGKKLKFFRNEKDLTQQELAKKSGLSTSLISKIERGAVKPSLRTLVKLSKSLGISACCFVFQLGGNSFTTEKITDSGPGGSPESREALLKEIIGSLFELDKKGLNDLAEYIAELKE